MNNLSLIDLVLLFFLIYLIYKTTLNYTRFRKGFGLFVQPTGDVDPRLSKYVNPKKASKQKRNKLFSEIIFGLVLIFICLLVIVMV